MRCVKRGPEILIKAERVFALFQLPRGVSEPLNPPSVSLSFLLWLGLLNTRALFGVKAKPRDPGSNYYSFFEGQISLCLNTKGLRLMKSEGQQEMIEPVLRPARVKTKASNVDLSKAIEIHLITTVHTVSTCGIGYVTGLTSGNAFSGIRVHSCPELAALSQAGPLRRLH